MVADFPPEALGYTGVNIPQTANDLATDDLVFECEELAKQADILSERVFSLGDRECRQLARLIASTNRNMARMMRGKQ